MTFPADAFEYLADTDVSPGTLFTTGDMWFLRVKGTLKTDAYEGYVRLSGPSAGAISPCQRDNVLALAAGYNWRPLIPSLTGEQGGPRTGAIVISDLGPVIWGAIGDHYLPYRLSGRPATEFTQRFDEGPAFTEWSAELVDPGNPRPLGRLFDLPLRTLQK